MLNVMLVDDEYIILKGLEALLTNQKEVPLRVFSFVDAVSALEEFSKVRPDIVITDINMPELDGLSFAERAVEQGYGGRFLIISGYEEVAFYRRAVALHTVDYLVKPVDKQKLISVLSRLYIEHIEAQQVRLLVLQQALAYRHHSPFTEEVQNLFPLTKLVAFLVQGLSLSDDAALKRSLSFYFSPTHIIRHGSLTTFLCNFDGGLQRIELQKAWEHAAIEATLTPQVGISCVHSIDDVMTCAARGLGIPIMLEAAHDYVAQMLDANCSDGWRPYSDACMVGRGFDQYEELCNVLQSEADPFLSVATLAFATSSVLSGNLPDSERLSSFIRNRRQTFTTCQKILNLLWTLPAEYIALESGEYRTEYPEKIEQAMRYLNAHYAKDISLGDVAQSVNLSPSYLSSLFTKEVGMTFLESLNGIRTEAASRLLESTTLSVEAVAEAVGYQSVAYFYKLFRDKYAVSPGQWRKARQGSQ